MATPTSHPRISPQKNSNNALTPQNHLTPPSTTGHSPPKYPTPSKRFNIPNGHARHPSNSHKMSDTSGSTLHGDSNVPMSRTGTNASTPSFSHSHLAAGSNMARTTSAANTPTPGARSAGESPAVSALMHEVQNNARTPAQHESPGTTRSGLMMGLTKEQQEEERKRRLELVVQIIGQRWGYVCQEGVEMLGRRLGFQHLDWEESMTGEETRTLNLAGEGILVEVEFAGERAMDVRVGFPEGKYMEMWEGAARVLKEALVGEGEDGYRTLEGFAVELERLVRMDKLLATGKINGFDAVGGIGKALEGLWEREVDSVKNSKASSRGQETVIWSRSGRPIWHARERVGFAVQYWKDQRLINSPPADDTVATNDTASYDSDPQDQIWSLSVECEPCPLNSYPSARIFSTWLSEPSDDIPPETSTVPIQGTNLSWLEPPLSSTPQPEINDDPASKPTLTPRFTAAFNPPILLPLQTVLQIHENANAPIPQDALLPTSYYSLLFPADSPTPLISERSVRMWTPSSQTWSKHSHRTTLFTSPSDLARDLTSLPFRHPMEVINLLPILRQWAFVSTLLRNSTANHPPPPAPPSTTHSSEEFATLEDELNAFLSEPTGSPPPDRDINISFTFTPQPPHLETVPQFQVTFADPRVDGGALASVSFVVGLNGGVERVVLLDSRRGGEGEGEEVEKREKMARKVGRAVEVLGDLGKVVEWILGQ